MSINARALSGIGAAIMVLSIGTRLSAAELPPPPQDPHLAKGLEQAAALYEKAASGGYLDNPDFSKPWPCAVPELELRKYVGALNTEERKASGEKALQTAIAMTFLIKDVSTAPIVATCKNGKLDGPLEFVIDYTIVTDTRDSILSRSVRVRHAMTVSAGVATNASASSASLFSASTVNYKTPEMQKLMSSNKMPATVTLKAFYGQPVKVGGKDMGYYVTVETDRNDNGPPQWQTMLTWPAGPGREDFLTYRGARLFISGHTKNGRPHGELKTYAGRYDGIEYPDAATCYEDGERIMTETCDVD